jgi:hypothetical protein
MELPLLDPKMLELWVRMWLSWVISSLMEFELLVPFEEGWEFWMCKPNFGGEKLI